MSWQAVVSVACAAVAVWLVLVVALWLLRPQARDLKQTLRILPDLLRLLGRLARDGSVPIPARICLWALLVYLALPIDVVPDFLPVIGYADDAIIVMVVLRLVARRIGSERIGQDWPGTPEGLATICALCGLAPPAIPG